MFTFIAVPLIIAAILPVIGKWSKRVIPDLLSNLTLLFLVCSVFLCPKNIAPVLRTLNWFGEPIGITTLLDSVSLLMLLLISVVTLLVNLYSIDYIEQYNEKSIY